MLQLSILGQPRMQSLIVRHRLIGSQSKTRQTRLGHPIFGMLYNNNSLIRITIRSQRFPIISAQQITTPPRWHSSSPEIKTIKNYSTIAHSHGGGAAALPRTTPATCSTRFRTKLGRCTAHIEFLVCFLGTIGRESRCAPPPANLFKFLNLAARVVARDRSVCGFPFRTSAQNHTTMDQHTLFGIPKG